MIETIIELKMVAKSERFQSVLPSKKIFALVESKIFEISSPKPNIIPSEKFIINLILNRKKHKY